MAGARTVCVAVALALFAGCGGEQRPPAQRTATATPAPKAPAAAKVKFRAADGRTVSGSYTAAAKKGAPAIVLLHELRGGRDQWEPLVPYLHAAGYATLAYDSRSSPVESERIHDLVGAVRWLRSRPGADPDRLGLVGASVGASTAVLAIATKERRTVDAAVALSPPDSPDIWRLQDGGRYRAHDVLFIADAREAPTAEGMLAGAVRSKLQRSAASGHGVVLLPQPSIREALLAWLGDRVR
jgi:pimeloyl-ACP methyl ester carboxylesterase